MLTNTSFQPTNTSFSGEVRESTTMRQVLVGKFLAYMKVFSYIFSIYMDKRKSSVKAGLVLSVRQFSNYTVKIEKNQLLEKRRGIPVEK